MPKMKSHKSAVKRFHGTGTGKIMHRHTKRAHSMIKKSPSARRRLYNEATVYSGKDKAISRQLPYGANF
jgi:large subunit ribosomal protein L35